MESKNDPIHKRLAEFVEDNIKGATFVGIGDDKEVFLSFTDLTTEEEIEAKSSVKDKFGDEITTIAVVVSVSMEEVTRMVDGLNQALEETEEKKSTLLTIGSF